ncbi:MAG: hypothetical protein K0S41_1183 [Anaerocolumna sp.]|jgi:cyclic lactone autoinducer peptide|nr:hypothetical protein [Anaerocolumna sp.]
MKKWVKSKMCSGLTMSCMMVAATTALWGNMNCFLVFYEPKKPESISDDKVNKLMKRFNKVSMN